MISKNPPSAQPFKSQSSKDNFHNLIFKLTKKFLLSTLISTITKILPIIIGERGYFMVRYSMLVVYRCSMTILFIGLLGLFVAGIADAGVNHWTATGPCGGNIEALAIDPHTPATVYAGNDAGVFKSTNGGENWTAINTGLTNAYVYALAIDPKTPATVYAGTIGDGVFKSTNGGENWTAINTGLTSTHVSMPWRLIRIRRQRSMPGPIGAVFLRARMAAKTGQPSIQD